MWRWIFLSENMTISEEAKAFIEQCYKELNKENQIQERLEQIQHVIQSKGTYEHTYEELEHGAKMAWRNSNKCIGRLFWNFLKVLDERHLQTEEDICQALFRHIGFATNKGKIIPTITIFKPEIGENHTRIWNHQLIRYAGYKVGDEVIGDPDSLRFTEVCQELGWKGERTHTDVLPLIIQIGNKRPKWFNIPKDIVLEVGIEHPDYDSFKKLRLKWYAVPIISDMRLEIGGIHYVAAPFNGWYMGTEIGARNLADKSRYNMLPQIALCMGISTKHQVSLWEDKAIVELNIAVLHSFKKAGVSIVDHHNAAEQFKRFEETEKENERKVTGNWSWLIPPISSSTTHVFHKSFDNQVVKPNYFYQENPYE